MTSPEVAVVPMTAEQWPAVERIYAAGISTGHATFEDAPPTWAAFDADKLPNQRLVAVHADGRIVGWAAASAVSDRCAYAGVVEHSVYVDPAASGRGSGRHCSRLLPGRPSRPGSGRSRAGSSRRTPSACACTSGPATAASAPAPASA